MSSELYQPLPDEFQQVKEKQNPEKFVDGFLKDVLPAKDYDRIKQKCYFNMKKHVPPKRVGESVPKARKKKHVTRKERHELKLLKCPKDGWNYKELSGLRQMWLEYIRSCIGTNRDQNSINSILLRVDLHGSEMKVVRSKCPSLVGKTGTCVMDTRNTFVIVAPTNKCFTIPKKDSVFKIIAGSDYEFTIYGKYFCIRPSERSVKKVKVTPVPDL